jgi:hypothetical protein
MLDTVQLNGLPMNAKEKILHKLNEHQFTMTIPEFRGDTDAKIKILTTVTVNERTDQTEVKQCIKSCLKTFTYHLVHPLKMVTPRRTKNHPFYPAKYQMKQDL